MSTLLDILNSTIIGGIIILMVLTVLDTRQSFFLAFNDDLIVQQNLTALSRTLEYDLKKIGFAIPEDEQVVMQADSTVFKFRGDIDKNWQADTLEYYTGSTSELASTANPRDRFLYRKVNGLPASGFNVGLVTDFLFEYLNQDGQVLDTSIPSNLLAIKMVRITFRVENPAVYGQDANPAQTEYQSAFWQQTRLVSRNLRR